MANSLSAAKRARQNLVRRARNAAIKSRVRTLTKNFERHLEEKSPDAAKVTEAYQIAVREYDRAWSKKVLKRRNASRHISRLTKKYQAFQANAG